MMLQRDCGIRERTKQREKGGDTTPATKSVKRTGNGTGEGRGHGGEGDIKGGRWEGNEQRKGSEGMSCLAQDASGLLPLLPRGGREHGPDRLVKDVLEALLCQRRAFEVPAGSTNVSVEEQSHGRCV